MTTTIPSAWPQAAVVLADLRLRPELDDSDWRAVMDWLVSTSFDDRSYLAGEVAAGLVRDRASVVWKRRFAGSLEGDSAWRRRFRDIILRDGDPCPTTSTASTTTATAGASGVP